jgi:membrane-bound lytic murein transglycosylase D
MLKKFLICCALGTISYSSTNANNGIGKVISHSHYSDLRSIPPDTTAEKKDDSLLRAGQTITDPKEGFKNLFITAGRTDGISMEQLNPLATSFVEDYIDKFGKQMGDMKISARPYFDMMDGVLTQYGLPKELKYLAVIESYMKTNAKSWAGAVGPWQFMPGTARNMGLKVTRKVDERRDMIKSTHAASKYLNTLFEMYGDWLLVIAAYNSGPGTVNSAIRKSGSRDFWQLQRFLPAESRNHVKKFIATHYIMEGEGGITTITKNEAGTLLFGDRGIGEREDVPGSKSQAISGRYNSGVIVKYLLMDIASFDKLNPGFDRQIASNGNYELRLPGEKMDIFMTKKMEILSESMQQLLNPGAVAKTNL